MSFSFKGLFQQGSEPNGSDPSLPPAGAPQGVVGNPFSAAAPNMQAPSNSPFSATPASPFGGGSPLFKVTSPDAFQGTPIQTPRQASPFATAQTQGTATPLTVGDVLPQLPPEIARVGSLAPDQPVAISPQIIDAALRSGDASVPIFEIYRVCPALFQTPISPQDPRVVPLPAASLPRLIASTQNGGQAPAARPPSGLPNATPSNPFTAGPASPFGQPPAQPANPFTAAQPPSDGGFSSSANATGTLLPPKRMGAPPPLVDIQTNGNPAMTLPTPPAFGTGGTPVFGGSSPFGMAAPGNQAAAPPPLPQANPFGIKSPVEPTPTFQGNPFSQKPANDAAVPAPTPPAFGGGASPFGMAEPAAPPPSPFQMAASSPATASNLASLFASASAGAPAQQPSASPSPFGMASPPPQSQPPAQNAFTGSGFGAPLSPAPAAAPSFVSTTSASGGQQGTVRIPLSSLLKGYSVAELGFDPIMVPSWIMTTLPASMLREQVSTGRSLVELGMLVDGITDLGFRNVLSNAKRDFQIRLPTEEISHALSSGAAPSLPNLAGLGTAQVHTPLAQASQPASQEPAAMAPTMVAPAPPIQPTAASPFNQNAGVMRVEPPQGHSAQPFAAPQAPEAPPSAFHPPAFAQPTSPFIQPEVTVLPPEPAAPPPQQAYAFTPPAAEPVSFQPPASPVTTASASTHGQQSASIPPPLPSRQTPPAEETFTPPARAFSPPRQAYTPPPENDGFDSEQLLSRPARPAPPLPALPKELSSGFLLGEMEDDEVPEPRKNMKQAVPTRTAAPSSPAGKRPSAASAGKANSSFMGLQPHNTNSDQMLLRALLCTDEDLNPQRVVEMTAALPGIAACVCIDGDEVFSHAGAHKPQAREFKQQAPDLIHHLHSLAPLIGISGAETFTLNAGDRLMTFCFPADGPTFGILHDDEPSLGLRDKITLIARELSRMLR